MPARLGSDPARQKLPKQKRVGRSEDGLTFNVEPTRLGVHVAITEVVESSRIEQSMLFESRAHWIDWVEQDHRRHRWPQMFAEMKRAVDIAFNEMPEVGEG